MALIQLAVVCDLQEENWPSMDLVADMLVDHLQRDYSDLFAVTRIRPPMRRRFTRGQNGIGKRFNADRFVNRFWDYPRFVKGINSEFDLFHVVDHSYGQLLHDLPSERVVITCHDLDTFQCILAPEQDRRSIFFRKMMQRTLSGFRRAARITCDSAATRALLLAHDLVPAERTMVVPNGVHPTCSAEPNAEADESAESMIGASTPDQLNLLHVGSTVPRKRIDFLLQCFARVREEFPQARLLRVGGSFTAEQFELVTRLDLQDSILVLPKVDRSTLAALYRRASLVLLPSEREGFGLPVVEALACGTPVVASDLDVLREVGGDVTAYCPVGDIMTWSERVSELLNLRCKNKHKWDKLRSVGMAQAAKFTWAQYTRKMVETYSSLLVSDTKGH